MSRSRDRRTKEAQFPPEQPLRSVSSEESVVVEGSTISVLTYDNDSLDGYGTTDLGEWMFFNAVFCFAV